MNEDNHSRQKRQKKNSHIKWACFKRKHYPCKEDEQRESVM